MRTVVDDVYRNPEPEIEGPKAAVRLTQFGTLGGPEPYRYPSGRRVKIMGISR